MLLKLNPIDEVPQEFPVDWEVGPTGAGVGVTQSQLQLQFLLKSFEHPQSQLLLLSGVSSHPPQLQSQFLFEPPMLTFIELSMLNPPFKPLSLLSSRGGISNLMDDKILYIVKDFNYNGNIAKLFILTDYFFHSIYHIVFFTCFIHIFIAVDKIILLHFVLRTASVTYGKYRTS